MLHESPQGWQVNEEMLKGLPGPIRQSVIEYEAYKLNTGLMHQIIQQMKEVPILPSEVPPAEDRNALQRVEFPEEGGVLTYMDGYDLPYRGFPYADIVEKIDVIKKVGKASVSGLYHSLKGRPWLLVTLVPALLVFRDLITAGVYTFYRLIERFRLKPLRLSRAMRELHRAMSAVGTPLENLRDMLRDLACNVLEFDNAYRFRAQDIVPEVNKDALKKNPVKELNRVITLMQSREVTQEIRDTWKLVKLVVNFYLRFDRKLLALVVDTLVNIDIDQFKLTPEDQQFCVKRKDYVFGFMK